MRFSLVQLVLCLCIVKSACALQLALASDESRRPYSEELLLGSWIGGRSLVPVIHTFQKDQQYTFRIDAKYNGGVARTDRGVWTFLWGDVLVWRTKDGLGSGVIEKLDKDHLEFKHGTKRYAFTRLRNPG